MQLEVETLYCGVGRQIWVSFQPVQHPLPSSKLFGRDTGQEKDRLI